jgi:hypothetical protein
LKLPSSPRTLPNLVARKTRSRRSAIALPTNSSLRPTPYMSAVSRKSIPRSIASWMVAIDSASSPAP